MTHSNYALNQKLSYLNYRIDHLPARDSVSNYVVDANGFGN